MGPGFNFSEIRQELVKPEGHFQNPSSHPRPPVERVILAARALDGRRLSWIALAPPTSGLRTTNSCVSFENNLPSLEVHRTFPKGNTSSLPNRVCVCVHVHLGVKVSLWGYLGVPNLQRKSIHVGLVPYLQANPHATGQTRIALLEICVKPKVGTRIIGPQERQKWRPCGWKGTKNKHQGTPICSLPVSGNRAFVKP